MARIKLSGNGRYDCTGKGKSAGRQWILPELADPVARRRKMRPGLIILIILGLAAFCALSGYGGYLFANDNLEPVLVTEVEYIEVPRIVEKVNTVYIQSPSEVTEKVVVKEVGVPRPLRPFISLEELQQYLNDWDGHVVYFGDAPMPDGTRPKCVVYAYSLMIDAAEHGYLLPTEILENEKHMVNCARIGLDFYFVEPQTKEIFRVVSGQLWREAR